MNAFAVSARPSLLARPAAAKPMTARRGSLVVRMAKGGEEGGKTWDRSVYGRVGASGNFNLLTNSIDKVGLATELMGEGPFTLFAPDDDSFGDALKALGTNKMNYTTLSNLPDIVKNHVILGKVTSADLTEGLEAKTLGGGTLKFTLAGGAKVNGVVVKKADVSATNGVIHVIKGVLAP